MIFLASKLSSNFSSICGQSWDINSQQMPLITTVQKIILITPVSDISILKGVILCCLSHISEKLFMQNPRFRFIFLLICFSFWDSLSLSTCFLTLFLVNPSVYVLTVMFVVFVYAPKIFLEKVFCYNYSASLIFCFVLKLEKKS